MIGSGVYASLFNMATTLNFNVNANVMTIINKRGQENSFSVVWDIEPFAVVVNKVGLSKDK